MGLLGDENETWYQEDAHDIEIAGVDSSYVYLNVKLAWFEMTGDKEWPSNPTNPAAVHGFTREVCLRVNKGVIPMKVSLSDGNELREKVRERIELRDREETPAP